MHDSGRLKSELTAAQILPARPPTRPPPEPAAPISARFEPNLRDIACRRIPPWRDTWPHDQGRIRILISCSTLRMLMALSIENRIPACIMPAHPSSRCKEERPSRWARPSLGRRTRSRVYPRSALCEAHIGNSRCAENTRRTSATADVRRQLVDFSFGHEILGGIA